jgi:hypothetical protein
MSRHIPELGNNYVNLPDILQRYQDKLDLVPDLLSLKGKTIEQCNREQVEHYYQYDQHRAQLDALHKYMSSRVDNIRGKCFRKYTENYSRELPERSKEKYIDHDVEYLAMYELYLAVVDAFRNRGYALRQINEARVHQFNMSVI